ncbi:hypothetical protein GCM10010320_71910 [Streptomyces caelestis]|nr:hypothetical protein GCM10010320_71910 [Streptomyces caelestis]
MSPGAQHSDGPAAQSLRQAGRIAPPLLPLAQVRQDVEPRQAVVGDGHGRVVEQAGVEVMAGAAEHAEDRRRGQSAVLGRQVRGDVRSAGGACGT